MKKIILSLSILLVINCSSQQNQASLLAKLPKKLSETSGITTVKNSDLLWTHNDSGNKNRIYGITTNGKIEKVITLKAKNIDWEDATSDEQGNLYIADFGNNKNNRKNLVILKIKNSDLLTKNIAEVEKIKFSYPNQHKFPPKKEKRFFDAESILYTNNHLYIFTKSRVKGNYGKTSLYKIPAQKGTYIAEFISEFNSCAHFECRITSADISPNKKTVALLTLKSVLLFTQFKNDNFLSGEVTEILLGFTSQKEAISFKNNNTVYITDEKANGKGGNLYEFSF